MFELMASRHLGHSSFDGWNQEFEHRITPAHKVEVARSIRVFAAMYKVAANLVDQRGQVNHTINRRCGCPSRDLAADGIACVPAIACVRPAWWARLKYPTSKE